MARSTTVILAAVDGTPSSKPVIREALALAQSPGAVLHLVHIVVPPMFIADTPTLAISELVLEGRRTLEAARDEVAEALSTQASLDLVVDTAARAILQVASDIAADAVIVGSNGKQALKRALVGSVSRLVLAKARCTVIVARVPNYPIVSVPDVEPPCPNCLATQRASEGDRSWCAQHTRRPVERHQ